ncbi:Dickkopf N-terminal cysteine-rich domain-containing protein [Actinokineospora diospyrosa]|uniref:Dickkopf N-terminal cysteine-rich region n=1 Tax=Actinokineospora diospyrosa TaxID=103728 RepID=A0ABT1IJ55_9PSEU|nr:Dickkopf N-terminal cysteine-rich domain-containing protein [Actinokineospora diospyrosa]MCP2272675.1 Dickkopf N-terminal cysteine-rich region [Actinokineospora diospyrosa]
MIAVSFASRLATDGLQQHLFAAPSTVAEACKKRGYACWSSSECCNGLWCSWRFICDWV